MCPGKGGKDCSVGRTSWEGWQADVGRLALVVPSAPPLSRHMKSYLKQVNGSGGALGVNCVRRPIFRLPPFPACSTH